MVKVCGALGAVEGHKWMVIYIRLLGIGIQRHQIVWSAVKLHAKLLELRKIEPFYAVVGHSSSKVGRVAKVYQIAERPIDTASLKNKGEVVA